MWISIVTFFNRIATVEKQDIEVIDCSDFSK
jgi:hypothetical protein